MRNKRQGALQAPTAGFQVTQMNYVSMSKSASMQIDPCLSKRRMALMAVIRRAPSDSSPKDLCDPVDKKPTHGTLYRSIGALPGLK
jgi:hypothetical protein